MKTSERYFHRTAEGAVTGTINRKVWGYAVALLLGVVVALACSVNSAAQTISPGAAYGFNEGSGSTTSDASGNGNTASLFGPSWTTTGRYGDALSFNGTNAYVEAANSSSLNPGTAATFSAWVNVYAANGGISSVINKWSQTIDDEYLFGLDSSNRLTFAWPFSGRALL